MLVKELKSLFLVLSNCCRTSFSLAKLSYSDPYIIVLEILLFIPNIVVFGANINQTRDSRLHNIISLLSYKLCTFDFGFRNAELISRQLAAYSRQQASSGMQGQLSL